MRQDDAKRELEDILRNSAPGEEATVQTEGQIEHPHPGADHDTDAWAGRKEADGSVTVWKLHT
jgi:hypothetical protein